MENESRVSRNYWRLRIESEERFDQMIATSSAEFPKKESTGYKIRVGDCVGLTTYDVSTQTGLIRAIGFVLGEPDKHLRLPVKWERCQITVKPDAASRHWWERLGSGSLSGWDAGVPALFETKFPALIEDLARAPKAVVTHQVRPNEYFLLQAGSSRAAPHILPHLGRIRTGAEWEALGINPYNVETTGPEPGQWSMGFGSFEHDGLGYTFSPLGPDLNELSCEPVESAELRAAAMQGKRYISVPYDAYNLRRLGVPLTEISNLTPFDKLWAEGRLASDSKDYAQAVDCFNRALESNPNDVSCNAELLDARVKVGDIGAIEDGFAFYARDMDCAIHCGACEKWLRLALDQAKDYRLALDIATRVIQSTETLIGNARESWPKDEDADFVDLDDILDSMSPEDVSLAASGDQADSEEADTESDVAETGASRRKYGAQLKLHYQHDLDKFIRRLGTLRRFLHWDLIHANPDRAEELRSLLKLIVEVNPAKKQKIDKMLGMLPPSAPV